MVRQHSMFGVMSVSITATPKQQQGPCKSILVLSGCSPSESQETSIARGTVSQEKHTTFSKDPVRSRQMLFPVLSLLLQTVELRVRAYFQRLAALRLAHGADIGIAIAFRAEDFRDGRHGWEMVWSSE